MKKGHSVHNCIIIELPKIHNRAGNITPLTANIHVPFDIERVYYLYDVPGGSTRGGHAHKELRELLVAASGSFDVLLDDGVNRKIVNLNRPYYGLYVTSGIWRELLNFSSGAICVAIAAKKYSESDYIRNYDEFKLYVHENRRNHK
jgi:hypothetical protein